MNHKNYILQIKESHHYYGMGLLLLFSVFLPSKANSKCFFFISIGCKFPLIPTFPLPNSIWKVLMALFMRNTHMKMPRLLSCTCNWFIPALTCLPSPKWELVCLFILERAVQQAILAPFQNESETSKKWRDVGELEQGPCKRRWMKRSEKVGRYSNHTPGSGWQQGLLQVPTLNTLSLVWSALVFWVGSPHTTNLLPAKKFSLRLFSKQHLYLKRPFQMKTTQCFLFMHVPAHAYFSCIPDPHDIIVLFCAKFKVIFSVTPSPSCPEVEWIFTFSSQS